MNLHWLIHTMLKIFLSGLISKMCRTLSDGCLCFSHWCGPWLVFNVPWLELNDRRELDTGLQDCLENFVNKSQRWSYSSLIRHLISCFLLLKEPRQAPWRILTGFTTLWKWQYVFLILAPSLFNYCLLWPFISSSLSPHHDSDHLSCFCIPLYQTQPHQLLQASSIPAIHLSVNLRPVDGHQQQGGGKPGHPHLDGKYQTIVGMRLNCRTRQACNSPPNH